MGGGLFPRPAPGAGAGGAGPARGAGPPWLTGRGTGTRLPFERHSAFAWGMVSGGWDEHSEPELLWVRVRASRAGRGLTLTNMAGDALGIRAEFARDAEGLTVRAAVSGEPGTRWAEYRFDLAGGLVRQEWPGGGKPAPGPPGSPPPVIRPVGPPADVGAWA